MATTFPASKQTFTDPSGTSPLATGPDHAALHTTVNDTLEAIQDTYGTTAGTNILKDFSAGQFPARVNSGGTILQSLIGGTLTNTIINASTLGTPSITGGTIANATISGAINNATLGSPTITGGTANSIHLGTPTFSAGAVATAAIAANAVTNSIGTALTGLSQSITSVDPSDTAITGGSVTLVTTGGPCLVIGYISATMNITGGYYITYLHIDGTQGQYSYGGVGAVNQFSSAPMHYISTPTAGTHTWKLAAAVSTGGTVGIRALSLNVIELKK